MNRRKGRARWRDRARRPRRRRSGLRARLTRMFALVAVLAVFLSTAVTVSSVLRALSDPKSADAVLQLACSGRRPPAAPAQKASSPSGTDPCAQFAQTTSTQTTGTQTTGTQNSSTQTPGAQPAETGPDAWLVSIDSSTFQAAGTSLGREVLRSAFGAAFLSALLAAVAAAIVTRQITRPLARLTEGAQRLEAGERGVQVPVPPRADELRTLTLTFNNLTTRLGRQEAWRRGLMADIAHDLRTPLSVLRSEIEAMQDGLSRPDDAGLARLHGEVLLLARLVSDLRTLSLAESGALSLKMTRLDLSAAVRASAAAHAGRAAAVGLRIVLDAPRPLPVQADPDRLSQVLNNLIDNALRYAAPSQGGTPRQPGTLELSTAAEGRRAVLRVRDHGPGFQPGDLSRAFERFYRADVSRTRHPQHGQSSGLGLAIARALMEAQGASIEARNHPQGGAEFVLSFGLE